MTNHTGGTTKMCMYCSSEIPAQATRCPKCQGDLRNWFIRHPFLTFLFVIVALFIVYSVHLANEAERRFEEQETENLGEPTVQEVAKITGAGNENTESFFLNGNRVRVSAVTCCGSVSSGSYSSVSLEQDGGGHVGPGLSILTDGSEKGQGQTIYRDLDSGYYYIRVVSGIDWIVLVEEII